MNGASLNAVGDTRCDVAGALDFSSVPAIWSQLEARLKRGGELTLSLAGVDRANSAGLVMLVEALDVAKRSACALKLIDVPAELHDLAAMSGCDDIIGPANT